MADQPQPEDQPYDPLPPVSPPEDLPVTPELHEVPVMAAQPPAGQEQFVEESSIAPQTAATAPDWGTKLFVLFFFLIVPPLGVILLAAVCWMLFKKLSAA